MDSQKKEKYVDRYLYTAAICSVLGFLTAFFQYDFWRTHLAFGGGLLFTILIVPFSISRFMRHRHPQEKDSTPQNEDKNPSPTELDIKPKDEELNSTRVLLVTADKSDRHKLMHHLTGWQAQVTACDNSIRAFTELLSAVDKRAPYHIALVDQRHLDMEPKQFAASIRSEATLHDLSLIHIGPENGDFWDQQLQSAGYSRTLHTPIDKTLLFNALQTAGQAPVKQLDKVASFIHHYARERSTLPPLEILVAANSMTLKLTYRILKRAGHQVFTVENGEQALNALESHYFDLAILEAEMPVVSGIEAIKLYRFTHLHDAWMPFILLAPGASTDTPIECRQADVDAILSGPIKAQPLLAAINQVAASNDPQKKDSGGDIGQIKTSGIATNQGARENDVLGRSTLRNLEELGSGQEFVHNLIGSFLHESENLLACMEEAFAAKKHRAYIDCAHAFKDSAGNIGALEVYKLSTRASHLTPDEFKGEGGLIVSDIRTAFENARQALMDYMSKQDSSAFRS